MAVFWRIVAVFCLSRFQPADRSALYPLIGNSLKMQVPQDGGRHQPEMTVRSEINLDEALSENMDHLDEIRLRVNPQWSWAEPLESPQPPQKWVFQQTEIPLAWNPRTRLHW